MAGETDRLHGRNGEIYRLYCHGRTQEWLAEKYNLTQPTICAIIKQVRDSIPKIDRDEEIQRSLEMLRELRAGANEVWQMVAAPVVAGKDGSIVYDPDVTDENGRPVVVRDHSGRIRALEAALKVDQLIANRLGLDAASKMDLSVTGGEVAAAQKLAAEAAARVHQDMDVEETE